MALLDATTRTDWPKSICSLWLSIRLEVAGEVIMLAAALFVALCTKNASLAGLALTSAAKMTGFSLRKLNLYTLWFLLVCGVPRTCYDVSVWTIIFSRLCCLR